MKYFLIYLLLVNALSFALMRIDKQKAREKKWRIPESTLMGLAAAGGSLGALVGMHAFHHKTLHKKFSLGIPLILAVQLVLAGLYWYLK